MLPAALWTDAVVPSHAQGYEAFYKRCYDNGPPEQVIASCTTVITRGQVDSDDLATAYKNRGNAYGDKRKFTEALEDYERAIAINPSDSDAFNARGTTYVALERYDLALQDFDQALRLNPASSVALSNRCFTKGVLGDLEQALVDCNDALRVRPKHPEAYASRGYVYLRLKRHDPAIADYTLALQSNPDDPYALFGRGIARSVKGDLRRGDDDIVAAQSIKPDIADDMARLGIGLASNTAK